MVKPWRGMTSPSAEQLHDIIHAGESATLPKLEMIRNGSKIGRLLDTIMLQREGRDIVGHHAARSRRGKPITPSIVQHREIWP